MTQARLAGLIAHLPDGVSEIYAHPATASVFPGSCAGLPLPGGIGRADVA